MGIDHFIDQIELSEGRWVEQVESDQEDQVDPDAKQTAFYGEGGEIDPHAARTENQPLVPPDDYEDLK
jgi:hypothetical protein